MRGAGVISFLLMLTLAIFAYAEASPFQLFTGLSSSSDEGYRSSRYSAKSANCNLGRHWSPQYGKCVRTVAYVAN
ncbi:MAG: hypothetical protein ABL898_19710 [Hyphomicrobiaceae bacterium]